MSRNWYRQLALWYFRSSKGRPQAAHGGGLHFRPHIETMETRLVPHTHTWTGAVSTAWSNPSNWIGGSPFNDNETPDIVFPASGVGNKLSSVDQITPFSVNSITFLQSGFTLIGADLIFSGDTTISATTSGTNTIQNYIAQASVHILNFYFYDHVYNIASGGKLILSNPLYSYDHAHDYLDKQGGGTLDLGSTFSQNYPFGAVGVNAGHLALEVSNAIPNTNSVYVAAGASLDMNNHIETIGDLSGAGTVNLGNGQLSTGGDNASTTFSGSITGSGGQLYKQGNGTFTLTGANTYANGTVVLAGTLQVDGSLASPTSVRNGATLDGTGTVAQQVLVAAGGIINPDHNNVAPDNLPGTLHTGIPLLPSGAVFEIRLKDIVTYGQLDASGSVDLTDQPTISPQALAGFNPSPGDTFTIINSTGGISGHFKNLPNNATLTIGGKLFQITYLTHSVILKQVGPDQPLTATAMTVMGGEGGGYVGDVATFTDADPSATPSSFTSTIDWGNGYQATGTITKIGTVFHVSGASTGYGEEGNYSITVTITDIDTSHDLGGSMAVAHSSIHVVDSPLIANGFPWYATEGQAFTNQPMAFCVDTGGTEALASYTVSIHWNDGSLDSSGTLSVVNGMLQVSGSHTYNEEGVYSITITIHDEGGSMVTVTSTANVFDAGLAVNAASFSATEGVAVSPTVATFTDADPQGTASDYHATIYWGDKSPIVAGTVTGAGPFSVSGSHTYSEEGIYTVVVTVQDAGLVYTVFQTIMVADAPLSANGVNVAATEGTFFTNAQVATFTDADPQAMASDYTATIDWGDSHISTGTIVPNGPGFAVQGDHTYSAEGMYSIHVTIHDVGGSIAAASSTATVADAPLAGIGQSFIATAGVPLSAIPVAAFSDLGGAEPPANYTATIDWGDASPLDTGQVVGGPLFQVVGNHTYFVAGAHTVTVTIHDVGGSPLMVTATAAVNSGPADHFAVVAPATVTPNVPFNVTVTVQDAFNNTVTGYDRAVKFKATDKDSGRMLPTPPPYPFNPGTDQGSHTFSVTLVTPGTQTITVFEKFNKPLTGSTSVTVMPGPTAPRLERPAPAARAALALLSRLTSTPAGSVFPIRSNSGSDAPGTVRLQESPWLAWTESRPAAAAAPVPRSVSLLDHIFAAESEHPLHAAWPDDLELAW
jgi:autotransporter-associated beta strand protein